MNHRLSRLRISPLSLRALLIIAVSILLISVGSLHAQHSEAATVSPDEALKRLEEGNKHFVSGKPTREHQSTERRKELAGGQQPFATILSCADSRVPPEL